MLKATVSGSFHRHMVPIYEAVCSLREAGVDVLSPSDPRVVDHIGDFLFVASDKLRSIKLVQDRHLQAIRASDFLWVVCPDGYTGPSTSMEIGAARMLGVPVFSSNPALDSTLGAYVRCVPNLQGAIQTVIHGPRRAPVTAPHLLLDPKASIASLHIALDELEPVVTARSGNGGMHAERAVVATSQQFTSSFAGCEDY